jgi:hypothetical protein
MAWKQPFEMYTFRSSGCWTPITKDMVKTYKSKQVSTSITVSGGQVVITDKVSGGGCSPNKWAMHEILGDWTKIRYTQKFSGSASCWSIHGAGSGRSDGVKSGLYGLDLKKDDSIESIIDKNTLAYARCDNDKNKNWWHVSSGGAGKAQSTVELRRVNKNQRGGLLTGITCNAGGGWSYHNIMVWYESCPKKTY